MKKSSIKLVISGILFVLIATFSWYFNLHEQDLIDIVSYADEYNSSIEEENTLFDVVDVVDGDTIKVDYFGRTESVRLIGIDTPEKSNYGMPEQCYAKEASDFAQAMLDGQQVYLAGDYTQADRDVYGRLLRYIFLPGQTNFNLLMIEKGYAFEYTYKEPYIYQIEFRLAEEEAKNTKLGLWSELTCKGQKKVL